MQPYLIVIGNQAINLRNVTHIEVNGRGTVSFHFSGSSQVISFNDPEAELFRRFMDESELCEDLNVERVRPTESPGPMRNQPRRS